MHARGGRRRAAATAVVAATLLLGACAAGPRLAEITGPAGLPPRVELTSTPFHPQEEQQCGPAALATVLGAAGHEATLDAVAREIFLPGREGSLQPEIVGAIRARGLVPYPLDATLDALFAELAAGRPVLVLQKQGIGPWPAWHYAVAVGYDTGQDTVVLRSGTQERLAMRAAMFHATWQRAGGWALIALEPGTLPARPELDRYMSAAAGLESVGQLDAARAAYEPAVRHWPDATLPKLGIANIDATGGRWREAERGYAEVLRLAPATAAAINNRAEALSRLGCRTAALRVLDDGAARLAPDDPLRPALARTLASVEASAVPTGGEPEMCRELLAP